MRKALALLVTAILIATVVAIVMPGLRSSKLASNERAASAALKEIASALADFRGNDRDKNGVRDFWTKDVASLYHLVPSGEKDPIRLLDWGIADADPDRSGATPYRGYWFAVLREDEEGRPYAMPRDETRFAVCAYPAEYGKSGVSTFFINEGNTVFKLNTQGRRPTRFGEALDVPAAPLPLVNDLGGLKRTSVVPVLQTPHDGRNLVWCSTFEMAWQELSDHFKGPLRLSQEPSYVPHLNARSASKADLDPSWYVAKAGTIGGGILDAIKSEMGRKFPDAPLGQMLPPGPHESDDVFAFAYLLRVLPFPIRFARYDRPFKFEGRDVHAFGVWKDGPRQGAASQARLLFYEGASRFAVELETTSKTDRLVLARIPKRSTLRETVQAAMDAVAKGTQGRMEEGDELLVPCFNFDLRSEYASLAGKGFTAPSAATRHEIAQAYQGILFRLDESGARLESWAGLYSVLNGDTPPPPRKIFFDGPFLILLMKTGAKTPYFAVWVEDPEILCAR